MPILQLLKEKQRLNETIFLFLLSFLTGRLDDRTAGRSNSSLVKTLNNQITQSHNKSVFAVLKTNKYKRPE